MKRVKSLFIATIVVGVLSFLMFALERLALTDIFHAEQNTELEWAVVNASLIPLTAVHALALASALAGLRLVRGQRASGPAA